MKLELLQAPSLPPLLVTKNNPWFWTEQEDWGDRYYRNASEIESDYNTGKKIDARIMFTLRSPETFIKLNKYLKGLIIDKPHIVVNFSSGEQKNIGDNAHEKIRQTLDNNGMRHIPMKFRHADDGMHVCSCYVNYNTLNTWNGNEFKKRFRSVPQAPQTG